MISSRWFRVVSCAGLAALLGASAQAGTIILSADADIWMASAYNRMEDDGLSVWQSGDRRGAVDFNLASVSQPILGAYVQLYAPTSGNNTGAIVQEAYLLAPPGTATLSWTTLGTRTQIPLDALGFYNLPAGSPVNQWYSSSLASAADAAKLDSIRTSADKNLTFLFRATSGTRDWDDKNGWGADNPPRLVLITESSWNAANGDWDTPGNWDPVGVPTSGDVINLANGGTANASGTLRLGNTAGEQGLLRVSNGTLNAAGILQLGNHGRGTVVQTGGVVNATRSSSVGLDMAGYSDAQALYQISGGQLNVASEFWIGEEGEGTFIQTAGQVTVNGAKVALGYAPTGVGVYEMAGGQLTTPNAWFIVGGGATGGGGKGTFVQTGGAVSTNSLSVGWKAGQPAAYSISGGSLAVATELGIGDYAVGTLVQTGGTVAVNGSGLALYLTWGGVATDRATYRISGGTLSVPNGTMQVGRSSGVGRFEVLGSASTIQIASYAQNALSTLGAAIDSGGISTIQLSTGGSFASGATVDMDIYGALALTSSKSFTLMQTASGSISGTPTQTDLEPGLPYTLTNTGTALTATWSGAGYGPVWDSYAVPSELAISGGSASGYLTILGTVPGRDVFVRLDLRDNSGPLSSGELAALADSMQQAGLAVYTSHPFLSAPYDLLFLMKPTAGTSYLAWDFTDYDAARAEVDGLVIAGLSVGVPEPSTLLLLAVGALTVVVCRRRK